MNDKGNIDLSSLKSIDLGPNWDHKKSFSSIDPKDFSKKRKKFKKKKKFKKEILNYEITTSYCAKKINKIKEGIKKSGKSIKFKKILY